MKVTIKDKEALQAIAPSQLLSYVKDNGWEENQEIIRDDVVIGNEWKKWNKALHRWNYVKIIDDVSKPDYASRMAENMMEMEMATEESQISIYAKLTYQVLIFGPDELVSGILGDMD